MSKNQKKYKLTSYLSLYKKLFYIWLTAISALLFSGCSSSIPIETSTQKYIDSFNKKIPFYMKLYKTPGVSITLIKDYQIIWRKGFGLANKAENSQITPNTTFRVASISKAVTAWGIKKLEEKGKLDLDTPVDNYLTRWHLPESNYNNDGVTIRRLLSHNAGLPPFLYPGETDEQKLPDIEEVLNGHYGEQFTSKLIKRPGTTFIYSNSGYTLLELIIEEVTGEKFEEYMKKEILLPLGMTKSSFSGSDIHQSIKAAPYNFFGEPLPDYQYAVKAAGGLYSTGSDLAHFLLEGMKAYQPEAHSILNTASILEMHTPLLKVRGPIAIFTDSYGLGHSIEQSSKEKNIISYTGMLNGWQSIFYISPETGDGIVVLTNSSNAFPLLHHLAGNWAGLAGIGSIQFSRVMGFFSFMLWIIFIITGAFSLLLLFFVIRQMLDQKREFNIWGQKGISKQIIKTGAVMAGILLYWFIAFPLIYQSLIIETLWLSISLTTMAVVLIISFILPVKNREKVKLVP